MELELPPWMDDSFLASALGGENKNETVKILKFSTTLAVAPGNNYVSRLYRVKVEYNTSDQEEKKISLIVKAALTKGITYELIMNDETNVFIKELRMYNEILPRLREISKTEFGPNMYYSPVKNVIVLKDLNEDGYEMCDRLKQLDFPHCEAVIKLLARFHAASFACHKECADLIESVGEERLFKEGGKFETEIMPWMSLCVNTVGGIASQMEGCKSIAEEMQVRADHLKDTIKELVRPRTERLNVLNHGDLWMNNILFKHNENGEIIDVKFVDFQVSRYTSPALDLVYFIWSSSNGDVRENKLNVLIETYRTSLNRSLEELGHKERLSAEELRADLVGAEDFVIMAICSLLPIVLCEPENAINSEDISTDDFKAEQIDENHQFMQLFKGKYLMKALPEVMIHFQAWKSMLTA